MAGFNYYNGVQGQQPMGGQGQMGGMGQAPASYTPGAYMGAGIVKQAPTLGGQSTPMYGGGSANPLPAVGPNQGAGPGSSAPLGFTAPGMFQPSAMPKQPTFDQYAQNLYGQQGKDAFYLDYNANKDLFNPLSSNTATQNSALAGGGYVLGADEDAIAKQQQNMANPYFASLKAMGINPNQQQAITHAGYNPLSQNSVTNYYQKMSQQGFTNGINPGSDWKTADGVTYGIGPNGERTGSIGGLNFNVTAPGQKAISPLQEYNGLAGIGYYNESNPMNYFDASRNMNTWRSSMVDPTMYGYQWAKPTAPGPDARGNSFSYDSGNYYTPYGYKKGQ